MVDIFLIQIYYKCEHPDGMEYIRQTCVAMTCIGTILVLVFAQVYTGSIAHGQISQNDSSTTSSTMCVNNQPCYTMTCTNNQPCQVSKSLNVESPYEDYLDDIEDMLDNDYD